MTGSVTAAESFDGTPPGEQAWDDQDGDGVWDSNEETYNESELYDFNEPSANLIIPNDMGKIKAKNDDVSISSGSITSEIEIRSQSGSVDLHATQGDVSVTSSKIRAKNGPVTITASGTIDIDDTTVRSDTGNVDLEGQEISAQRATIDSKNGRALLSATGGSLDLQSADVFGQGDVVLESNGDMDLDSAELESKNGDMTADLGTNSATLSVTSTSIDDGDDTLVYDPSVTLSGSPSSGCVEQSDGSTSRCA